MEFTLLGAAALAVGAIGIAVRLDPRARAMDGASVLLSAALVGMAVGRLVSMLSVGANPVSVDFLLVRGGVSTVGASAGALAWLLWTLRRQLPALDALAPSALWGLAGWHAGCLVRSSCLGAATDLPWGWSVAGSSIDRHPVELYAVAILVAGSVAVRWLRRTSVWTGVATLASIGIAGAARLLTEPLRLTLGELQWFYGLSAVVGLAGAVVLAVQQSRKLGSGKSQSKQQQEDL